jgi:hypothetical protein
MTKLSGYGKYVGVPEGLVVPFRFRYRMVRLLTLP